MNQQLPNEDTQQPFDQPETCQQTQPTPWRWYRSRTRKTKMSIACATFIAVLLFCLFINAALGNRSSSSTTPGLSASHTTKLSPTAILMSGLTPPPAHISTPATKPTSTTKGAPAPFSSPSVYYGVHVSYDDISLVATFEADAHKPVAIIMWYQQWGLTDGYQYFQPGWMNAVRAHGSIPLVTWDPLNPSLGPIQPAYSLQNIINGYFDAYITRWAQASKAWGHPYFLRFAHEMNGNWNPWSEQINGNKPGQFVLAWRHVHDIFAAQGVTNVTWVWSPNIDYSTSTPLWALYPGDSYVNWVAMDGYNWGNVGAWHVWESFSALFQQTYRDILAITSKPLMIAETASTEQAGNKAAWIADAYNSQLPHYFPRIRAVIWFNIDKETDWRIESSSAAQSAFATALQAGMYTSNNYAYLNISPIPIP